MLARYGWQRLAAVMSILTLCALLLWQIAFAGSPMGRVASSPDGLSLHGCPATSDGLLSAAESAKARESVQAEFERIYQQSAWGKEGGGSGTGSTTHATRYAKTVLELVMHKYRLHSIVDAPCGAMVWIPTVLRALRERIPCLECAFSVGADCARSLAALRLQGICAARLLFSRPLPLPVIRD